MIMVAERIDVGEVRRVGRPSTGGRKGNLVRIDSDLVRMVKAIIADQGGVVGVIVSRAARAEIERLYGEFRQRKMAEWGVEAHVPPPPAPPSPPVVSKKKGGGSLPKNMERDRAIVAMAEEGHSQRAIAKQFELSVANVSRILTTARRKALAAEMEKEDTARTEETEGETE